MADEEKAKQEEPVDDAIVVHDEAAEEKSHQELVDNVAKMLDRPVEKNEPPKAEEPEVTEPPADETNETEEQGEEPVEVTLTDDLKTRAQRAGLSEELAQRLHQSGSLEEALAAFDKRLLEQFQSQTEKGEKPKQEPVSETPPEKPPELDPEVYDEELIKRDAYHQQRIDALEAQLAQIERERASAFDEWFDHAIDELGRDDLFGQGTSIAEEKQANRDKVFKAYQLACALDDIDIANRDRVQLQRAFDVTFIDDLKQRISKETQQQTVQRLRDSEGKFLPKSTPRGAPPAKGATEEEIHDELVSNVTAYLKKQGVQMSGV